MANNGFLVMSSLMNPGEAGSLARKSIDHAEGHSCSAIFRMNHMFPRLHAASLLEFSMPYP